MEEIAAVLQKVFSTIPAAPPQQKGKPKPAALKALTSQPRFTADNTLNRVIVTAPPEKMPEIRKLIETLDSDKPADVTPRIIQVKQLVTDWIRDQIILSEVASLYVASMPLTVFPPGRFHQDSPHRLGCRSKEMAPAVPMMGSVHINESNVGLVHERRSLKCLSWLLL